VANPITELIAFCNTHPTIFATFGNRITGDRIPDGQLYPNARVLQVSSKQHYVLNKGKAGRKILLQVDVYADTIASADSSVTVLEDALSGYKGMLGTLDAGYVFVKNVGGDWAEQTRNEHRILEMEIGTND